MKAIAIFLMAAVFLFGCTTQGTENGFLEGHIDIGPICPVESFPPDPSCEPTEQTYLAYELTVYKSAGPIQPALVQVTQFHGDKDGNYKIELESGTYQVMYEGTISKFNETVEIKPNETTRLDISIDTGIR
ncbi:MAG: hypothetical protein QT03_C0001G1049 [archaeon GW2011_AR10]|uniref:Carboxypeptidase regulatory-like domain-containing protein n=1 Tax=Candidatus Iainarchaeum sp. TaxID=3101447 RepID=A0A7J4IQP1_9ARCH|nr:MAG: hypothetical protein QT03_C0001G1049 [archaeon GW2011_AR10]HIH07808.1 hypothetical protein [Candidatus Diapherotrites archaeon]